MGPAGKSLRTNTALLTLELALPSKTLAAAAEAIVAINASLERNRQAAVDANTDSSASSGRVSSARGSIGGGEGGGAGAGLSTAALTEGNGLLPGGAELEEV